MRADCAHCDGFGHVPEGVATGWYARDWRLLLDPTVRWLPCPTCADSQPVLVRVHERLSRVLIDRLDSQVVEWHPAGGWRSGTTGDGQAVWRWRDVAVLPPGPMTDHHGWMLVSSMGVQRALARDECGELLRRMGAPALE